jgi:hypothetical protein
MFSSQGHANQILIANSVLSAPQIFALQNRIITVCNFTPAAALQII